MAVFWILATLMTALALAFVLVPLLRTRVGTAPTTDEANLDVLRAQRREIDADVASGVLPSEERAASLEELVRRADQDLAGRDAATVRGGKPWRVAIAAGVLMPLIAFGTYLAVGTPRAADPAVMAAMRQPTSDAQIVAMVDSLAAKMKDRPDDPQGWSLLARSMAALGRFKESSDAYERLAKLTPDDPQVLADWADSLGMAQGRTLAGKPYELAKQALKIDANHRKALALAGTAAMDAADFTAARDYWTRLAAQIPPESPDHAQVQQVLAEVAARASTSGTPLAGAPRTAAARVPATSGSKTVSGSVALAPALASQVSGGETLFIFARAEGGPRVPLAVIRASAKQLPMQFALDDTQAMAPNMKLSGADAVRIEARVSRSGNAMPQPGDLVGSSAVVKPGARDVKILVDKVVP
jgi:cytochrome c-type biogenesis protein CcmH